MNSCVYMYVLCVTGLCHTIHFFCMVGRWCVYTGDLWFAAGNTTNLAFCVYVFKDFVSRLLALNIFLKASVSALSAPHSHNTYCKVATLDIGHTHTTPLVCGDIPDRAA